MILTVSLTDIAKGMVNDADDSTMDASELALILNSSVNTKQYNCCRTAVSWKLRGIYNVGFELRADVITGVN